MNIERKWIIDKYIFTVYSEYHSTRDSGHEFYTVKVDEKGHPSYFLTGNTLDGSPNVYESYSGFMGAILDFLDLESSLE